MRKLTHEQKVRVTPEQSEKMQRAWFAAGKTWQDGSTAICDTNEKYLYLDKALTTGETERYFINQENNEIELIDEPQADFASQQEVWAWLGQGNKVKNLEYGFIAGFKSGEFCRYRIHDGR